ncbi:peptidoglycan D,D-transpeptidase FtsI family protein [Rubrivivax rivuli]|uniref:Peptidoglycan D,D-transpeptidase FtsI n=1 Tax=Rubrivivax rivuli TaxID=1862385 RepID=A0A437RBV4_9BURK|nr:penicillin-binding protein 2 [Rubrivivax rivuli]RVU44268.1 penicillin-binding protein 2 [Rubrivivax rivuli]
MSTPTTVRSVNYATSPLLASKTPPWRSRFVVLLVGLAFLVLLGRAVHLQIIATDFYQAQGEKRFVHKQPLPASRGRILDRNGLVLATSVALPSVQVDAKTFSADTAQRKALAQKLEMPLSELNERLDGVNSGAVVLRRHVEEAAWQDIKAMGLKGVQEVREYKRRYPEGEAAAHVVGFTNIDGKGQEGIELGFQTQLLGQAGQRQVVRDRLGRVVEDIGDQANPVHGQDITLSIDSKVQFFAYQRVRDAVFEHKAKAGSVVVLDTQTGEVLALANYPSYDPANRKNLSGAQLRNRALTDIFEPGSTMKPFVAALALETGRVTPDTPINTAPGRITITGSTINDAHPHGVLTVAQVIQKSSNVGTVKLALAMPARELWEMYTAIGLGQKPRIDFPGAVTGRLRPYKTWRPIEHATMSYGYGLSASLFQLARAYTVFARDGELIPVTIQRTDTPTGGQRVMSAKTAQQVRQMLLMATSAGGTGTKAQAIGYSVGGKSGTARKQEGKGYGNKYRSWFVGLAPVGNPRIVVAVMVDEPGKGVYYGGEVAAPVFSQVVQQTLRMMNVAPDIDVKAQISAKPVPSETESF